MLLCDTNHVLTSEYSEVRIVGAGADAVDLALINLCKSGDIVVTQDYGVAALALGKAQQNGPERTTGVSPKASSGCYRSRSNMKKFVEV